MLLFTRFSAYFGTIRKNKIDFSDDIQRIFSHKPTLVGVPLFNSAKIRTKGAIGLHRDLDTPTTEKPQWNDDTVV